MFFKYDENRIGEHRKNTIFALIPMMVLGILTSFFVMYLQIQDVEKYLFTILIIFIVIIIFCCITLLVFYKAGDKNYLSYQIECNDNDIIITSKNFKKIIKIEQIKKISKDGKNNIYITTNNINKVKILNYIENIEEFELFLSKICQIELYVAPFSFIQYIPLFSYFIWLYIVKIGNFQLYFIFGFFIFFTTIFSLLKLIFDQLRFRYKIVGIIFDTILILLIGRALILSILNLLN